MANRRKLTTSLAIVSVSVALLFFPRSGLADEAAPPTDAAMIEGRKHFRAGVSLIEDPDGARYEEAYHAFQKAYALSRSPKVLGNIGLCALKLERDGEAIDAYTAYLRETPDVDASERAQIERDLNTLNSNVGVLRVIVPTAGTYVVTDSRQQTRGAPILNAYSFQGTEMTLRLRPGHHTLKVKSNDAESAAWEVIVEPGARASHEMKLVSPAAAAAADAPASSSSSASAASSSGPSYVGPVLLGVLGVAGLGVGVTSAVITRSKETELADRCPNQICPTGYDLKSTRTDAKTYATVADVAMIGGGVALVGAIVWALALPSRSSTKAAPRTGSLSWSPACGAQGCKLQIGGSF